jgi:outer membrane lipoprotein SlyB
LFQIIGYLQKYHLFQLLFVQKNRFAEEEQIMKTTLMLSVALFLIGCAARSQSPVLYPNNHLKNVGEIQAQKDIEECSHMAESYVKANPGAKVVGGTIVGGAGGAVVGGAVGAVTGDLARGASVGAAAGAASGLVRGIYKASRPSPVYKAFVNRCLKEKGYDPIGWE